MCHRNLELQVLLNLLRKNVLNKRVKNACWITSNWKTWGTRLPVGRLGTQGAVEATLHDSWRGVAVSMAGGKHGTKSRIFRNSNCPSLKFRKECLLVKAKDILGEKDITMIPCSLSQFFAPFPKERDSIKLLQWGDSWRRLFYRGWCAFDGAGKCSLVLIHGFQWSSCPKCSTPFRCANAVFVQELHCWHRTSQEKATEKARIAFLRFSWC